MWAVPLVMLAVLLIHLSSATPVLAASDEKNSAGTDADVKLDKHFVVTLRSSFTPISDKQAKRDFPDSPVYLIQSKAFDKTVYLVRVGFFKNYADAMAFRESAVAKYPAAQVSEITSNEFIIGMGYRVKGIRFNVSGVLGGGKKTRTNSDLNLKLDFSIRRNKTVLRRVDQDINTISVGQQVMTLNFSADYNLSARFNVRFYFDKIINTPYVSNQYRTSNTKGGIALRFTLGQ